MFPASTKGGGNCAGFPDVCKVPAPPAPFAPTPFPNTSQCTSASDTSSKVKIANKPTITKSSSMSRSNGDEAGTLKGMVSQTNMDKVQYRMGAMKVKIEGQQIVTVGKMCGHNGTNSNAPPGAQVAPSQTKVIIMG